MKNSYSKRKITSMVNFFYKKLKFCILVVHYLTNDISYDANLNRLKKGYFWGTILKTPWKKFARNGNIFVVDKSLACYRAATLALFINKSRMLKLPHPTTISKNK